MTRSRSLIVGLVALVAIGIGVYVVYDQVLRGDAAPALALPSAAPASEAPASEAPGNAASSTPSAPFDGDVVFCLSTAQIDRPDQRAFTIARLGELAASSLARAIARGVHEAAL